MQTAATRFSLTTAEGFEDFLALRDDPDWIVQQRREAFALYQELCRQELDPEEYRRLDLRVFRPTDFALQGSPVQTHAAEGFTTLMAERADFAGHVAHGDGFLVRSELAADLSAKGVIFCSLNEAAEQHPDLLREYLMTQAVKPDADRFTAWHAAFWTGGTFLYVPRGVRIQQPLHSLIGLASAGTAECSHTLVVLEEGAEATLLEETGSMHPEHAGLHLGAVELLVGREAKLRYVQLQDWNDRVFHLAHQCGRVQRDGSLQWTVGALGSKVSHVHQDVMLDGRGAEAQVNGVAFASDRQKLSFYTRQAHKAPDTRSDLLYKEVVRDRARMIWRGMIEVDQVAQQTDGYQRNDSLILSREARVDAIPGLEIKADDVRCTHGATAGQVDEEQILYCMCRGISRKEAMHLIVEGFFAQVFDRIQVEAVRETLSHSVQQKLGFGN
ncbi:MAG: Fe-S cluster assembly protein SufD [Planctomycetaceae bacterium]|nr:Fe-S cluster assembly protein SufD [Planctomycetaceae bacterium]